MTEDTNVTPLIRGLVAPMASAAVHALDNAIVAAINAAKAAQVPQGLVVGVLHAHAHQQTSELLS